MCRSRHYSIVKQSASWNRNSSQRNFENHFQRPLVSGAIQAFADADVDTLAQVNITAEPGQTIALVGRSGSGKTTLVNMLPRFVAPAGGQVLIDGRDIESVSLRNLREQLSLVSQDVVLFDDTIAVNVGYGALHDASEAEIRAALQAANLLEFVDGLPLGIQTKVG